MRYFGKETKQDPLQAILWGELLLFFVYVCLQLTEENWIIFKLGIRENSIVFLEILAVLVFAFLTAFLAFLLELDQNGMQELKVSPLAATAVGCLLLLISPYVVLDGVEGSALSGAMGAVALAGGFTLLTAGGKVRLLCLLPCVGAVAAILFGFCTAARHICAVTILLTAINLAYQEFSNKDKVSENRLVPLVIACTATFCGALLCFVPAAALYGIYLPLLLSLTYVTWQQWERNLALQKASLRTGRLHGEEEKLSETMPGDEATDAKAEKEEAEKEAEKEKGKTAEEGNAGDASSPDAGMKLLNTGESVEQGSEKDKLISQDAGSQNGRTDSVGGMILSALPDEETWIYLLDKENGQAFHYLPESDTLTACGQDTEPELTDLIPKEKEDEFRRFIAREGTRQIEIPFWSSTRSCYRDAVVMASPMEGNRKADILISYDITESNEANKTAQRRLQEEIIRLKQQIELEEDEAHRMFLTTNEMLYDIIEKKSGEPKQHLRHVSRYADILLHAMSRLYPELGYTERDIRDICEGSVLHDIGKIEIPDAILNKHEQLTPEEFEIMKMHPVYGARIINQMPYVKKYETMMHYALELALHHHERVDGSGYPDRLKGEQILPYVEAVALADVYEALTSRRSYRESLTHEQAVQLIESGACGAFSDKLLTVFKAAEKDLEKEHYTIETKV